MVGSILSMLWNVWLQILLKFVLSNMLEPQKLPKNTVYSLELMNIVAL